MLPIRVTRPGSRSLCHSVIKKKQELHTHYIVNGLFCHFTMLLSCSSCKKNTIQSYRGSLQLLVEKDCRLGEITNTLPQPEDEASETSNNIENGPGIISHITKPKADEYLLCAHASIIEAGSPPPMPPKAPSPCACTAGKDPGAQVTAQMHWPVPGTSCPMPWLGAVAPPAAGGAAGAATGGAAAGGAAAVPLPPPVMALGTPVPFCAMAMAWNMAWVFSAVGLTEKAMPLPQWPFCLQ